MSTTLTPRPPLTADHICETLQPLAAADPRISALWLLGSYASGFVHPRSDVDLGVLPATPDSLTFWDEAGLSGDYGQALHIDAIDIVNVAQARPLLRKDILEGIPILVRDPERVLALREVTSCELRSEAHRRQQAIFITFREKAMVQQSVLVRKRNVLLENIQILEKLQPLTEDAFFADFRNLPTALRCFQVAIEAGLDAFAHIVVRSNLAIPQSGAEVLDALARAGLVSRDHIAVYQAMVGFRNRIVHDYEDVRAEIVYRTLQNNIPDLRMLYDDITDLQAKFASKDP